MEKNIEDNSSSVDTGAVSDGTPSDYSKDNAKFSKRYERRLKKAHSKREEFEIIINRITELEQNDKIYSENPFISGKVIVKDFDMEDYLIRAVDHLSIDIEEGEYIAIIGASGAGKTTLLHLLAGLNKPNEGKLYLAHIDIIPMSMDSLTTFRIFSVGVIFQAYNLISSFSAFENVIFPMQLAGTEQEVCDIRAQELLEHVGLGERRDHLPFQLSAGEQQRVAIARALANDPPIIIADEPTANLDSKNAHFIASMFEEFQKNGKTIVVATHDEKLIQYANRIITMEEGKIISDERISQISPMSKSTEE